MIYIILALVFFGFVVAILATEAQPVVVVEKQVTHLPIYDTSSIVVTLDQPVVENDDEIDELLYTHQDKEFTHSNIKMLIAPSFYGPLGSKLNSVNHTVKKKVSYSKFKRYLDDKRLDRRIKYGVQKGHKKMWRSERQDARLFKRSQHEYLYQNIDFDACSLEEKDEFLDQIWVG